MTKTAQRRAARVLLLLALAVSTSLSPVTLAAEDEAGDPSAAIDGALLEEALGIIERRYVDGDALSSENLTGGAIRGIVEALGDDGHTVYLTAEELQAERESLEGRVTGIGVVVDQRGGVARVISVIDGSPADIAGVHGGDIIVTVDGTDISRVAVGDVSDLVRGAVDTVVRLGVERPGASQPLDFEIVRDSIEIEPVSWAFVPGSEAAVVRIVQFSAQAGRSAGEAIEAAISGGASGLVLDLRGNPGGLVNEALVVAGSLLTEGVAYLEQGRDGNPEAVDIEPGRTIDAELPMVVLVDYGTASSAEILAAALRDNDRAAIVGEQTFGTGTVLNTFTLSDGSALRIGILRWLTPNGVDVFRVGVEPDHPIELPLGAVALVPGDLLGMTATELERSRDLQLLGALDLLPS